jgi:hypothetical protein
MHNLNQDTDEIHVESLPFQQIPNWVFESGTSPTAIKLYLVLRKNGDNKRHTSYWSRKKLAEQMSCSINTVDRAKAELITLGAICYIKRKNDSGDWTSNLYHIHSTSTHDCKYLAPKLGAGSPKDGGTGSPKTVAQTNNHIELRTNELKTRTYGDENHQACNLLADLIEANGSRRPTVSDKWQSDMDKLNRIDERSWDQITRAIEWCQADDFWRGNIMSPAKLRKQYDQLRLAAQRNTKQSKFTKTMDWLKNLENETKELEQ